MNEYNTIIESDFRDSYIPIPFDQLMQIGKEMNARRDAAERLLRDTTKEWAKFSTMSDIDRAAYNARTFDRLQPLLDQFAADPNMIKTAAGQAALSNLINSTDYAALAQLQLGADAYERRAENIAKLKAAGKYDETWDDVNMKGWDTLNQGVVGLAPLEYRSVVDIVKPFLDNLGEKSYRTGTGYIWKGKNKDMVEHQVQQNMSSILNSPFSEAHIRSIMRQNPGMTQEAATRQYMDEVITASHEFETSSLTADPIYVQQMINNRYGRTRSGSSDSSSPLQDWMSRNGKVSQDTHAANFDEFASDEYKDMAAQRNQNQAEMLVRAEELQTILDDSVSTPEVKESAKQQLAAIKQNYFETAKIAEAEDKHEIVKGALTRYVTGLKNMSDFFSESKQLWTGNFKPRPDGSYVPRQLVGTSTPGIPVYAGGYAAYKDQDKETRSREPGNVFDLNSEKYNKGWFKDDNEYSDSDVDDMFNYGASVVMIPSENGNIKAVEEYLFKNLTNYGGDQSGYDLPSKFRIKSTAQFLGEYDPMLKEQANSAGINLDLLRRDDFPIPQWLNGNDDGKISGAKVHDIIGLNFSEDIHNRQQVDILMNVDVPLSEIERLSNEWWGEEEMLRKLHFQIVGGVGEGAEKYVRVPVVITRPYNVNFSSFVNPTYQHQVNMPSTAIRDNEAYRSLLEYMTYGISPADQYVNN